MRKVYYTHQGDAKDVLEIGHLPKIEPKSNKVRVKVITSDVNPSDIKIHSNFGGSSAKFVVIDLKKVAHLPDNVSFEKGSSLGIPAMTAHRTLFADRQMGRSFYYHYHKKRKR